MINGHEHMKNTVAALLNQQVQCVLATHGDEELALHLMAYAISTELDQIYFASLANTQKVANMRTNPNVTCLWDNRTGNNTDHTAGLAMSGFGQAHELTGEPALLAQRLLLQRNTTLKPLLLEPALVLFALHIDRYQWVEGYTRVVIYKPEKSTLN
ncbi:MAG: nitroimidazol reductase NimA-like FMN-containing flavoprotein [Chitinophagales bacterium]|jgi:nitroimidazol reductase NimA-like FMN-containing flavoprotein (pyridoxamine 5'-phosphate oxidase superfamily)|tara:strand:- start:610 stop:1077 length:468 start_codon:yes stop_codon:yes gene_type:complete